MERMKREKKTKTKILRVTESLSKAIDCYADIHAINESEAMRRLVERGIFAESNSLADTRDY